MAVPASHPDDDVGQPVEIKPLARPWHHHVSAFLMLPREHGAWAMLLMPYLLGTIAAGWGGWPSFLLLVSVLALFTAGRPLEMVIQGGRSGALPRLIVYGVTGGLSGLALPVIFDRWVLLPLAAAAGLVLAGQLFLRRRRLERTWPARLASIAALSATGPAAFYVASGTLDIRGFAAWALSFLYLGASVFYVRLSFGGPTRRQEEVASRRTVAERQMEVYLAFLLATVGLLSLAGLLPRLSLVAFGPLVVKASMAIRGKGSQSTLKSIGFAELAHSAVFLVLAVAMVRM